MIKSVSIAEEIRISTRNKVGLLADIAAITANEGINIDAVLGYEAGRSAKILLITPANLAILAALRKKRYKFMKETEVVLVELINKPGALKVVTTELKNNHIDIKYVYITSCSGEGSSKMVLQTNDNEKTMSLLTRYVRSVA